MKQTRIMKNIGLAGLSALILTLQGCYTNRPTATSVSSPDYNKRVSVSGAGYRKKGNAIGVVFNVGMIGAGAYGGYNMNLVQQQTGNGREPVRAANAAIGALAGASVAYLIDQIAGKNKTYPVKNTKEWIRKANDDYRFLNGDNDQFDMIHSSIESRFSVKSLDDVKDFKTAFPNSNYAENVVQTGINTFNLSDLISLAGIYPQYEDKIKNQYLQLALNNSSTFAQFKSDIGQYPGAFPGVNLGIDYQNEAQIKDLFAQFDRHTAELKQAKARQFKNEILDGLPVITTCLDSIYEQAQYDKIASSITPQSLRNFIHKFPNSSQVNTVKSKLNKLDDENYASANRRNTQQDFENYVASFPGGNHLGDANLKIAEFKRIAEEIRIVKEREERERLLAAQLEEENRQRLEREQHRENFMKLEGKKVYWRVTLKIKTNSMGSGLIGVIGDALVGDLNYTSYQLKYTGIVEKIIGDESAKIIVSNIEIEDPGWASVNYLKYKSSAMQMAAQGNVDGEVGLGNTTVKQYGEIQY
jgi:outer membrane protein assembly factor BamD (BamD/ComL family)